MADLTWATGYLTREAGLIPNTWRASYSILNLSERGLLATEPVIGALEDNLLRDYCFDVIWHDEQETPDADLVAEFSNVEGVVIFMHGWTGNRRIWESLPEASVTRNPRVIAIAVDHNGFGLSPFVTDEPALAECSPVAAMRVVERMINMLRLRRQPEERQPRIINFVGHSMGGAALFFLNDERWKLGEDTRLALAPALLLHDEGSRIFYNTLGLGIGLVGKLPILGGIEGLFKPSILEVLTHGSSNDVKHTHLTIYNDTPRTVTSRTLGAMGTLVNHPMTHDDWDLMRVVLAHRDPLVGLVPMLDLLNQLKFEVEQIRVVLGTHYLFSVGEDYQRVHQQNREIVLRDIFDLHQMAMQRWK